MKSEIEKICDALLYEGYTLFPYRKNALKNQKRFNFGVLSPKIWAEKQINEHYFQQTEILALAESETNISIKTRFLQVSNDEVWQTARDRSFDYQINLGETKTLNFELGKLNAGVDISTQKLDKNLFKLTLVFQNRTESENLVNLSREKVLEFSFVSVQTIFELESGEFISTIEAIDEFSNHTKSLKNVNSFPVLAGDKIKRNCVLASPIILYDFPEISQKSFDNFFDGLEIDELMVLNILGLTDAEKKEIAKTDEKTRRMLEKIENASAEELLQLHAKMSFR